MATLSFKIFATSLVAVAASMISSTACAQSEPAEPIQVIETTGICAQLTDAMALPATRDALGKKDKNWVKAHEKLAALKVTNKTPLVVQSVCPKGSAFNFGLREGDKILAIDGRSVLGRLRNEAISLIRDGSPNTSITLTVDRSTDGRRTTPLTLKIWRETITMRLMTKDPDQTVFPGMIFAHEFACPDANGTMWTAKYHPLLGANNQVLSIYHLGACHI